MPSLSFLRATASLCAACLLLVVPALASLPLQTFESAFPGYSLPAPWRSSGSPPLITDLDSATGEHALLLTPPTGTGTNEASLPAILLGDTPGFADLWLKPVARTLMLHPAGHASAGQPTETSGVLYLDGAHFLFQRHANRYSVLVLTRSSLNQPWWLRLGGLAGMPADYEVEDTGGRAKDWLRVTVRRDLAAATWDVWLNERLVGVDLALQRIPSSQEFRLLHRPAPTPADGPLAPILLDDLQASAHHPLYQDTDRDAMPDVWEAAYEIQLDPGLPPSIDLLAPDRAADVDLDLVPKISEYFFGSRPNHPDSDGDGISDGVEIQHGLNPASFLDAAWDKDGDGFSNLAESQGQGNGNISAPPVGALTNVIYIKADHSGIQNGDYHTPLRTLQAALLSPRLSEGGRIVIRGEGGALAYFNENLIGGDILPTSSNGGLLLNKRLHLIGVNMAQVHLQQMASFATVSIPGASAMPVLICENINFESCWGDDGGVFRILGTPGEVVLRHCRFSACRAVDDGGAIYAHAARLTIEDCWFEQCRSGGEGGALHAEAGTTLVVRRSHFSANVSGTDGGAISLRGATLAPASVENGVFQNNTARRGGAVAAVEGADATLLQCTLSSNLASLAGGGGGVYGATTATVFSVSGSILWNNTAGTTAHAHLAGGAQTATYSTLSGWTATTGPTGIGNNGTDPVFRAGTLLPTSSSMLDSSNPNHQLNPANAGDATRRATTDFLNNPRWDAPGGTAGTLADRGAFERQPDSDADGLSDDWEIRYALNPSDPADAGADADQDGYSNYEEFTDKTDPRSAFSLKSPVVYVSPSAGQDWHPGPNPPPGTLFTTSQGSRSHPFKSIRRAILACPLNRRIVLLDGTYGGPSNTNCRLNESWIWTPYLATAPLTSSLSLETKTIRGLNGSGRVILDGGGATRLFDLAFSTASTMSSSVTLQNLTLRRGVADLGGAIRAAGSPGYGSIALQGCVLSGNRATTSGGAVHVSGASVAFNKCTLSGNDAPRGGAVSLANLSPSGNSAYSTGAFIQCRFAYNLATRSGGSQGLGGAICAETSYFYTMETRFDHNHAERHGGALALLAAPGYYPPALTSGTVLESNTASERGGALFTENTAFTTFNTRFQSNIAGSTGLTGEGGAVFVSHPATAAASSAGYSSRLPQFTTTRFLQNRSGLRGGAVAVADASPLFTNCALTENTVDAASGTGGALAVFWLVPQSTNANAPVHPSAPRLIHTTFARNRAGLAANLHSAPLTTPWLINSLFSDGFATPATPSLVGPRHLHGCQIVAPDTLLTAAEADPARRNLAGTPTLAFDWHHLATPVRLPADTTSTTGGIEPSATVSFTRPSHDIDNELRPAAATGKFTLMRGCDEPRDSDGDSLPDWFEWLAIQSSKIDAVTSLAHTHPVTVNTPTLPTANPTNNADADAYTLTQELLHGGRPDAAESATLGRDSDGDGLSDLFERLTTGLDWRNPDLDGDGFSDGWEFTYGFSVTQANPGEIDTDGDGVEDYWEHKLGFNPQKTDSDEDGTADGDLDADGDGVKNGEDAHPQEPLIAWPRVTETPYFVLPLTTGAAGFQNLKVYDINAKGEVVGFADPPAVDPSRPGYRIPVIWRAGAWSVLGPVSEAGKFQANTTLRWFRTTNQSGYQLYHNRFYTTDQSDLAVFHKPIQISDDGTVAAHAIIQNNAGDGQTYTSGVDPISPGELRSLVWPATAGLPAQYPRPLGQDPLWPPPDQTTLSSAYDEPFYLAVLGADGTAVMDGGGVDDSIFSSRLTPPYASLGTRAHPLSSFATQTQSLSANGTACGWLFADQQRAATWNSSTSTVTGPGLFLPISIAAMPAPPPSPGQGPLAVLDRAGFLNISSSYATPVSLNPSTWPITLHYTSTLNERGESLWQVSYPAGTPPHLWRNGRPRPVQSLLNNIDWSVTTAHDLNNHGLILASARPTTNLAATEVPVLLVPIEVVELAPRLRDADNEEIADSEVPKFLPASNSMVEEAPLLNQIAHREVKLKLARALKNKKIIWSADPQFTPVGEAQPRYSGTWENAATNHRDHFEASTAYGVHACRRISQAQAETTVDPDGITAIRINLPPIGFNRARIKIHIEGSNAPIELIDVEVPAVVVIDPGHGGTSETDFTSASWNNSTSPSGVLEKQMSLAYSLELYNSLQEDAKSQRLNMKVLMTRSTDLSVSGQARADIARQNGADSIFIIHFNASQSHTARGSLEVRRESGNVNPQEDINLIETVLTRLVAAMQVFDKSSNLRHHVINDTSVASDTNLGNRANYFPIRAGYCEVDFIDYGAHTADKADDAVDFLLNTGPNAELVRSAIANAMSDGIIHDLKTLPRTTP